MAEDKKAPARQDYKLRHPIVQGGKTVAVGEVVKLYPRQIESIKTYEAAMDAAQKAEGAKEVIHG